MALITPLLSWGNFEKKPKLDSKSAHYFLSQNLKDKDLNSSTVRFSQKGLLGVGFSNFRLEYQANIQFKGLIELGAGLGVHTNSVKFFSASDEHMITVASLPTYATMTIYPYHDANRAFYIKGNYGLLNNIDGKRNKNEKGISHRMLQFGIGYKHFIPNSYRFIYFELSKYTSTAKGRFSNSEDYNSVIDYNLTFHAITFSVGIDINRY